MFSINTVRKCYQHMWQVANILMQNISVKQCMAMYFSLSVAFTWKHTMFLTVIKAICCRYPNTDQSLDSNVSDVMYAVHPPSTRTPTPVQHINASFSEINIIHVISQKLDWVGTWEFWRPGQSIGRFVRFLDPKWYLWSGGTHYPAWGQGVQPFGGWHCHEVVYLVRNNV